MRITFYSPIVLGTVNEGSSFPLIVRLWSDQADRWVATTATSARYRIDCISTGRNVLDWTSVTPSSEIDLTITGAQNAIIEQSNPREQKQVTVEINHGLATQYAEKFKYLVENNGAY